MVSPDALRRVLATVNRQFDTGRMNDAAETFDMLLDALHATAVAFTAGLPGESSTTLPLACWGVQRYRPSACFCNLHTCLHMHIHLHTDVFTHTEAF